MQSIGPILWFIIIGALFYFLMRAGGCCGGGGHGSHARRESEPEHEHGESPGHEHGKEQASGQETKKKEDKHSGCC